MIELNLRTDTEADMLALLDAAGLVRDGAPATSSHDHALDIIGVLYDPPETEDGEPVQLPGWHTNLICVPEIAALFPDDVKVSPKLPRRVWA